MRQTVAFAITLSVGLAVGLLATTVSPLRAKEPPLVAAGPPSFAAAVCVGGPGLPECSEASLGNARTARLAACGGDVGYALVWCDEDGGIERMDINCKDRKPDAIG